MSDQSLPDIPLPSGWAKCVKTAVLHVISLAHYAIVAARGWAANSINARVRLTADNDQLKEEAEPCSRSAYLASSSSLSITL